MPPLQPVLVLPVYRGGEKFRRALASVRPAERHFRRIVISLNSAPGSPDEEIVADYLAQGPSKVEVIQSGTELPWMSHQYFWLDHLERTGERSRDWVLWFAHDDQIRTRGIERLVNEEGVWPLTPKTIYLGPWGMRYDPVGGLYGGPAEAPVESWTSFPLDGPLRLPVAEWIGQQLAQPTYINMSGCITQLASFQAMRAFPLSKPGGMRIEMAAAAAPHNTFVEELSTPVVITHTSPSTDRTTYASVARKDDIHMTVWLANYILRHPRASLPTARAAWSVGAHAVRMAFKRGIPVEEDWRHRETVEA